MQLFSGVKFRELGTALDGSVAGGSSYDWDAMYLRAAEVLRAFDVVLISEWLSSVEQCVWAENRLGFGNGTECSRKSPLSLAQHRDMPFGLGDSSLLDFKRDKRNQQTTEKDRLEVVGQQNLQALRSINRYDLQLFELAKNLTRSSMNRWDSTTPTISRAPNPGCALSSNEKVQPGVPWERLVHQVIFEHCCVRRRCTFVTTRFRAPLSRCVVLAQVADLNSSKWAVWAQGTRLLVSVKGKQKITRLEEAVTHPHDRMCDRMCDQKSNRRKTRTRLEEAQPGVFGAVRVHNQKQQRTKLEIEMGWGVELGRLTTEMGG